MVVEYIKISVVKYFVGHRDGNRSIWNSLGHIVCCVSNSSKTTGIMITSFHEFEPDVLHYDEIGHVHQCHGVESSLRLN